ncbi:actin-domain-containing protein [Phyllosticta citricarpa]
MASSRLLNAPIVIDNGSGTIRAGFAGQDVPKCYFNSWVGRPKHVRALAGALEGDFFIGKKADGLKGLLKINYPLEHGVVTDWDDMERIWQYLYTEELKTVSEDHPVLLTEAPLNPRTNRDTAAQILFETFNVPALYTSIQAVLSLYASGRTTGVVLDAGDGVSHAVPVFQGFQIANAIQRIDIAGRDVTDYLQTLLRKSGYVFHTSAEKEIVKDIKQQHSYVCLDPIKEEKEWTGSTARANEKSIEYRLPDGQRLKVGAERFRAPEILFNPELIGSEWQGVHQMVVTAINRTDLDLRKDLYSSIVLSGGCTLTKGFGDRLLHEIQRLAVRDMKIRISAPPERIYTTWTGGSILAGLSTFKKVSKAPGRTVEGELTRGADVGGKGRVAGESGHYPHQVCVVRGSWWDYVGVSGLLGGGKRAGHVGYAHGSPKHPLAPGASFPPHFAHDEVFLLANGESLWTALWRELQHSNCEVI